MSFYAQALMVSVVIGVASAAPEVSSPLEIATAAIPPGTFEMGCSLADRWSCSFSGDQAAAETTTVVITRPFEMMKTEVSQDLYKAVTGKYSTFEPACIGTCPANKVNWYDAIRFANKLSKLHDLDQCYVIDGMTVQFKGLDCTGWRLPTEAEWEYAARGGQDLLYSGSDTLESVGWALSNPPALHSACELATNGYGLCDMSGNVSEWVWDGSDQIVKNETLTDPLGKEESDFRVQRGGSYRSGSKHARVFHRDGAKPEERDSNYGFRLVRSGQKDKRARSRRK